MKKKTKKVIMLVCALLMLITAGTGGYTYAKYVTAIKGGGQAEVAQWSFKLVDNGLDIKNIQLANTVQKDTLINGKIAPGTSGQFFIELDGTGAEVGIDYTVKFSNEQNKPTNIIFSYAGVDYKSLSEIDAIKGTIKPEETVRNKKIQILWRWDYETGTNSALTENDNIDTEEGVSALDYTFDVVVKGTQSI